jgi:hypothetical protein
MVSARVQLRVVAAIYALFGVAFLLWIAIVGIMASTSTPTSPMHELDERAASAIPSVAMSAVECLALSGLALCFLKLGRLWRVATIAGSSLLSLLVIWNAVRVSAADIPEYLAWRQQGGPTYPLVVMLATWWGIALVYSACSLLLWRHVWASKNRWRGP